MTALIVSISALFECLLPPLLPLLPRLSQQKPSIVLAVTEAHTVQMLVLMLRC